MSGSLRRKRLTTSRSPFRLEALERRQLLSGIPGPEASSGDLDPLPAFFDPFHSPGTFAAAALESPGMDERLEIPPEVLAMISTSPAHGETFTEPPSSLTISFNVPVEFFWLDGNVMLYRVEAGGHLQPVFSADSLPQAHFDEEGTRVTIPLDQPLEAGTYRIVLIGGTDVADFASLGLWDPSQDQPLAEFTILNQGLDFDTALDLGVVGPEVTRVEGFLNLVGGRQEVALYKITLEAGHFWRLGVQVDAQRLGSQLRAGLTLFDAAGNPIESRDAGLGRPDFPADPYLFKGVVPGVYYLAVSGAGNLPAGSGNVGLAQDGGSFELKVAADPADVPTRVLGFTLRWLDSLDPSPTGLEIQFSGPIDIHTLFLGDDHARSLQVVDDDGRVWSVTPSGYDEKRNLVVLSFDEPLPAGRYALRIAAEEGLADLAGRAPIAAGLPDRTLARWTVLPRLKPRFANDLGVLWPGRPEGFSRVLTLGTGQSIVYRVVVSVPGLYSLERILERGALAIRRIGPDGVVALDLDADTPVRDYVLNLREGVYLFVMTAQGSEAAQVRWVLKVAAVDAESLINNGVGQTPALQLRMLGRSSSDLSPMNLPLQTDAGPAGRGGFAGPREAGVEAGGGGFSAAAGRDVPLPASGVTTVGLQVSTIPANLLVTVNSGLLGRPNVQATHIAAVGPAVEGGLVAMANVGNGFLPGILALSSSSPNPIDQPLPDEISAPEAEKLDASDGLEVLGVPPVPEPGSDSEPEGGDLAALVRADRLAGLVARLGRWFTLGAGARDLGPSGDDRSVLVANADTSADRAEAGADEEHDQIEQAELGVPTTLLVVSALAYRLRRLVRRWRRRRNGQAANTLRESSKRYLGAGPWSFRRRNRPSRRSRGLRC